MAQSEIFSIKIVQAACSVFSLLVVFENSYKT